MDQTAIQPPVDLGTVGAVEAPEQRRAQRYSLLIRPAKLTCAQGEFVCVLRDVSASGMSARLFHDLPNCDDYLLELQSGQTYEIRRVWTRAPEAGFEFAEHVDVTDVIGEFGKYPKRGLRLSLEFPVTLRTLGGNIPAYIQNISQQGARFECDELLALDQALRIESADLREIRAKVRWRRDAQYGVVFDDTFSLREFAQLAAHLQAPGLIGTE